MVNQGGGPSAMTLSKELPEHLSRAELIERYSPLVKIVAYKVAFRLPPHVDIDDLISAGILGLIDSIDKYDEEKSNNFKKYAEIRIRGAILDELRSMDWVSRSVRRRNTMHDNLQRKLEAELGRRPTDQELARALGVDVSRYFDLLQKLKPVLIISFEDLGVYDDDEKRSIVDQLRDHNALDPAWVLNFNKIKSLLAETIDDLPEKQKIIISLYYFEEMNLKEIGAVLDVTESRVSQLHGQAVRSLRLKLKKRLGSQVADLKALT